MRSTRDAMPALDAPPAARGAAGPVPAHSVLPEALSLLLLPRLHGQERAATSATTSTCWCANGRPTPSCPAIAGRPLDFVYFGGGTPSFLSIRQLEGLVGRLSDVTPWSGAEEITFECEPGTLTDGKLAAIRGFGVTRLSLGVESFDDGLLELNGRAHRSPEIFRAYETARSLDFPQINIDLIAGMLGETDDGLARERPADTRARSRQRDHLSDGAAVQHDDQRATS